MEKCEESVFHTCYQMRWGETASVDGGGGGGGFWQDLLVQVWAVNLLLKARLQEHLHGVGGEGGFLWGNLMCIKVCPYVTTFSDSR